MKCCFWKKHFRVRCIKSVPENEPCWDHFQRKRSLKWPLPTQVEAGCKSWGWLHWDRLRHITCLLHTGQVMDKVTAFFLRLFKRWEVNEAWHFGVHSKGPWVQTAWPLLVESMFDVSLLGYVQLASPQALFPDLLLYIPVGCYFFSPSGCTWISVLWWFFFPVTLSFQYQMLKPILTCVALCLCYWEWNAVSPFLVVYDKHKELWENRTSSTLFY